MVTCAIQTPCLGAPACLALGTWPLHRGYWSAAGKMGSSDLGAEALGLVRGKVGVQTSLSGCTLESRVDR